MNIIADVAGQYNALLRLLKKMPDEEFICVGDLVDRGPKSKEVVQHVMTHGKSLLGNHEDMMLDYIEGTDRYSGGIWLQNGGYRTVQSYSSSIHEPFVIPGDQYTWLKSLPIAYIDDQLIVTHAPIHAAIEDIEAAVKDPKALAREYSLIWNRSKPRLRDRFQIFGHNSHWGLSKIANGHAKEYALCIDDSAKKLVTGVHWPSLEVFQEPYENN